MSEVMIGGELIKIKSYTEGETMQEPLHAPDEFIERETEFTDADIEHELMNAGLVEGDTSLKPMDNSLFASFIGYTPQPIEEKTYEPRVLQGKYNAVITRFERMTGTWPSGDQYDKYNCSIQITDTVDAKVDGTGTYINRDYNLLDTAWKTGKQSVEDMLNEINQFVGEIQVNGTTEEEVYECIDMRLAQLVGEPVTVRVWPQKYKKDWNDKKAGEYKTDKKGYVKHSFAFATHVNLDEDVITQG